MSAAVTILGIVFAALGLGAWKQERTWRSDERNRRRNLR